MAGCFGSNAAKLPFFSKSSHVHGFSSLEMPDDGDGAPLICGAELIQILNFEDEARS